MAGSVIEITGNLPPFPRKIKFDKDNPFAWYLKD